MGSADEGLSPACLHDDGVAGGLILATYAIFGFLAGYLWARRYLMGELAGGRREMLATISQQRKEAEDRTMDRSKAAGLVQHLPRGVSDAEERERLTAEASQRPADGIDFDLVQPGPVEDDPWKGQFGGRNRDAQSELSATVSELSTRPGLYQIEIRVRGTDQASRVALANQPVRVYLHPTFRDPIRSLRFDLTGELRLPLIAYGAFTVGVQFSNDARLELDLAGLSNAPEAFRQA